MATETAVPDHVTTEGKENEELKTSETEIVSSPKVEELAAPKAPVTESEEKTEDKKIDPPAIIEADKYMDAEKVNDGPGWDVPIESNLATTTNSYENVLPVSEPAIKDVEKETSTQPDRAVIPEAVVESVEKPIDSPLTPEPAPKVETKLEEVSEESKEVVEPESVVDEQEVGKAAEELAAPKAPVIESVEKTEDKKIDQPEVIEADKYMDAEKVNDGPGWDGPAEGNQATTTNSYTNVIPVSELEIKDEAKETLTQADRAVVPEAVVESVEGPIDLPPTPEPAPETQPGIVVVPEAVVESVEKPVDSPPTPELAPEVEKKLEEVSEESKEVVEPESVVEEQEAGKAAEVPPKIKEVVTAVSAAEATEIEKPLEISASESKVTELPESVVEVEKSGKHSENNEDFEKESDVLEPKESTERELAEKEELINEVEEVTESLPEKEAGENQVSVAWESAETVASEPPSGPVDVGVYVTPDVSDKAQAKEPEIDVLEESTKEASPKVIKAEDKNVKDDEITEPETTTNEKVGDTEQSTEVTEKPFEEPKESGEIVIEKNDGVVAEGQEISKDVEVVAEVKKEIDAKNDSAPVEISKDTETQSTKAEGEGDLSSAGGVTERSLEVEKVSKDLGVVTEEKKEEDVKDFSSTSVETGKDTDGDVKTVDIPNETVSKPKELDSEPKAAELANTGVDELEKTADVVEETPKSDARDLESSKGTDESKTNEDLSKEEVPKKHSHGIMSKMKQSIVKVKKAITGKSPNSKTISSDAKDDIKVK